MELVFGELHFSPHLSIGPLPFFKGSLSWENNAIFSSHCFTLCERRHSAFNSETDHKLKLSKTDNLHRAVELPPIVWYLNWRAGLRLVTRDHVRLLNQQKCVQDQFSWFKSLGGLLCSTTVVCKRIVFIMNASKDFNAKYSLVRLLTFVLFQNRLL